MVGAGAPSPMYFDAGSCLQGVTTAPPRSRLQFSNYGRRVDIQGWGCSVVTTGYGDFGSGQNMEYTTQFNGTSSATPIVAGAAACIQGVLKARGGQPFNSKQMREVLILTGTSQVGSEHIGPLPDLRKAIASIVTCGPTRDLGLHMSSGIPPRLRLHRWRSSPPRHGLHA